MFGILTRFHKNLLFSKTVGFHKVSLRDSGSDIINSRDKKLFPYFTFTLKKLSKNEKMTSKLQNLRIFHLNPKQDNNNEILLVQLCSAMDKRHYKG